LSRKVSVNICKAWCLDERCCSRILGLEVYHAATFTCVPLWVLEAGNNTDDKEVEIHVKPVDKRGAGSPAGARFLLLVERQYHARNDSNNIAQPQTCHRFLRYSFYSELLVFILSVL